MLELTLRCRGIPIALLNIDVPGDPEFDSGRFAPLVEYRVERIDTLEGYEEVQPTLRAAGEAILLLAGRRGEQSDATRGEARRAIDAVDALRAEMDFLDPTGQRREGRVTLIAEPSFGQVSLPAIGVALTVDTAHLG
jgi:hypothetical protein